MGHKGLKWLTVPRPLHPEALHINVRTGGFLSSSLSLAGKEPTRKKDKL
jgi:hypothetical protein